MKNRIIALLLTLAMLFAFASCDRPEDEIPEKDKDLTVEIETVEYDADTVESAASRISAISAELIRITGKESVSEEKGEEIAELFKSDLVPILIDIPVYPDELAELLDCAEKCLLLLGEDNENEYNPNNILDLYTKFSATLDTDRLGALVYELQLLTLNARLEAAEAKYDKHGSLYLGDVEYYTELVSEARALGRDSFSDAFSVLMFMISSSAGSLYMEGGAVGITPGDAFVIMKNQGEKFSELSLADEQWQTVAAMCEEFIPTSASDNLKSKLLLSLEDDDFFIGASILLPDLIDFYAAMSSDISKECADIIKDGAPLAYERALYGELIKNETALRALLIKMKEEMPETGSYSLSAVKAYDREGYLAFLERDSAEADDVILVIKSFSLDPTEEKLRLAEEKFIDFVAGINPVIAYVYLYLDFAE